MATAGEILHNQQFLENAIQAGLNEVRAEFTHVKAVITGLGGVTGEEIADTKRRVDAFAISTSADAAAIAGRVTAIETGMATIETAIKDLLSAGMPNISGRATTLESQTADLDHRLNQMENSSGWNQGQGGGGTGQGSGTKEFVNVKKMEPPKSQERG